MPIRDNSRSTSVEYGAATEPTDPPISVATSLATYGQIQQIEPQNLRKPKPVMGKTFNATAVRIGKAYSTGSEVESFDYYVGNKPYRVRVIIRGSFAEFLAFGSAGIGSLSMNAALRTLDSSLADASLTKTYAKLAEPEFDLGTTIGELRETIEGLANPLSALRKYGQQMKQLHNLTVKAWQSNRHALIQKKRAAYTLTALGGSWLEWRMGIKPLLKTIEDLKEYLTTESTAGVGRMLRCRASVKKESDRTVNGLSRTLAGQYTFTGKAFIKEKWRTSSIIYYNQDTPLSIDERLGVDFSAAPAVMWELTRLSFVVDRFIRVGEFLQSLRPVLIGKQTILGTVTSEKYTADVDVYVNNIRATPGAVKDLPSNAVYSYRVEHLNRVVNRSKPVLPAINWSPLKFQQHLDHLSLLWQAIPKTNWRDLQKTAARADKELAKVYFDELRSSKPKRK